MSLLLRLGLFEPSDVVHGGLRVLEHSSRNANTALLCRRRGYVVKQPTDETARQTLRTEAALYELARREPGLARVSRHLPRLAHRAPDTGLLVTEHLGDVVSLTEYQRLTGRFSGRRHAQLAAVLARFHDVVPASASLSPAEASVGLWSRSLAQPPLDVLREASAANLQLLRIVQAHPSFARGLADVQGEWQASGVVHGDLKWDNVVVAAPAAPNRGRDAWWLLDWELGGAGDARWDVGCALAELLRCWILSAPVTARSTSDAIPGLAQVPLERLHAAARAFGTAYAQQRSVDLNFFADAARFAAARLAQIVYEHMQYRVALTSQAVCLLQLSHNVLLRPREALFEVFGAGSWS